MFYVPKPVAAPPVPQAQQDSEDFSEEEDTNIAEPSINNEQSIEIVDLKIKLSKNEQMLALNEEQLAVKEEALTLKDYELKEKDLAVKQLKG